MVLLFQQFLLLLQYISELLQLSRIQTILKKCNNLPDLFQPLFEPFCNMFRSLHPEI